MRYITFQQQVTESRGFQQNVQKQTGNTKKNSVRLLQFILCWAAGKCTTEKRQYRRLLQDKVVTERKVYSKLAT